MLGGCYSPSPLVIRGVVVSVSRGVWYIMHTSSARPPLGEYGTLAAPRFVQDVVHHWVWSTTAATPEIIKVKKKISPYRGCTQSFIIQIVAL